MIFIDTQPDFTDNRDAPTAQKVNKTPFPEHCTLQITKNTEKLGFPEGTTLVITGIIPIAPINLLGDKICLVNTKQV